MRARQPKKADYSILEAWINWGRLAVRRGRVELLDWHVGPTSPRGGVATPHVGDVGPEFCFLAATAGGGVQPASQPAALGLGWAGLLGSSMERLEQWFKPPSKVGPQGPLWLGQGRAPAGRQAGRRSVVLVFDCAACYRGWCVCAARGLRSVCSGCARRGPYSVLCISLQACTGASADNATRTCLPLVSSAPRACQRIARAAPRQQHCMHEPVAACAHGCTTISHQSPGAVLLHDVYKRVRCFML